MKRFLVFALPYIGPIIFGQKTISTLLTPIGPYVLYRLGRARGRSTRVRGRREGGDGGADLLPSAPGPPHCDPNSTLGRPRAPPGRPRSRVFSWGRFQNRPRDHHKRTLHALELRMHQTSSRKNEIEAVSWLRSLHSPRFEIDFKIVVISLFLDTIHIWTLHALELRMHHQTSRKDEIEAVL